MAGITVFEVGNCVTTPLILRATELFQPGLALSGSRAPAVRRPNRRFAGQ
jgi:hypothetical protein